jgi:hypothetical protein
MDETAWAMIDHELLHAVSQAGASAADFALAPSGLISPPS